MSVKIRITEDTGDLVAGHILEAIEIDSVGDARVYERDKYPLTFPNSDYDREWIFANEFEVVGQTDHVQRIEELEAEVARLRKLLPSAALLPQEVGVWKSDASYYVRLGEDDWLYANPYEVVRRTDAEMASGTRDAQGVPRIGEKIN